MSTEYLVKSGPKYDLTVYEHSTKLDLVLIKKSGEFNIFSDLSDRELAEIGLKLIEIASYQESDLLIWARSQLR